MRWNDLTSPGHRLAIGAGLLALSLSGHGASATEPYRVLSPSVSPPHPAVLLVPGCSGFAPLNGVNLYDERAGELRDAGYFVVFVDYLGRRHLGNCGHVSHAEVAKDILEAAVWTRGQAGIDPGRISAIGWSYGGGGVLAALRTMPPGPPVFQRAVLYYPDCRRAMPWTATGVSALMFLGELDDVTRPALCDPVVKGARTNNLRTILYPNARHAFDLRSLPERAQFPFGTLGHNAEAARSSWAAALDFLSHPNPERSQAAEPP
jgi:dienelactone hydrolase